MAGRALLAGEAAAALVAAVMVTRRSHLRPSSPWWVAAVGRSRLRRADLPMVGAVLGVSASALAATGRREAAGQLAALALGAGVGALATGVVDPLPRGEPAR